LLAVGFASGFAVRAYVLPVPAKELSCSVDGLASLEEAHGRQVATLNGQLVLQEAKATNHELISPYQELAKDSANRLRTDIKESTASYLAAIDLLSKKCK
jgi:hypothetical protein